MDFPRNTGRCAGWTARRLSFLLNFVSVVGTRQWRTSNERSDVLGSGSGDRGYRIRGLLVDWFSAWLVVLCKFGGVIVGDSGRRRVSRVCIVCSLCVLDGGTGAERGI